MIQLSHSTYPAYVRRVGTETFPNQHQSPAPKLHGHEPLTNGCLVDHQRSARACLHFGSLGCTRSLVVVAQERAEPSSRPSVAQLRGFWAFASYVPLTCSNDYVQRYLAKRKIGRPSRVCQRSPNCPHVTSCQLHEPLRCQQISFLLLSFLSM